MSRWADGWMSPTLCNVCDIAVLEIFAVTVMLRTAVTTLFPVARRVALDIAVASVLL